MPSAVLVFAMLVACLVLNLGRVPGSAGQALADLEWLVTGQAWDLANERAEVTITTMLPWPFRIHTFPPLAPSTDPAEAADGLIDLSARFETTTPPDDCGNSFDDYCRQTLVVTITPVCAIMFCFAVML